MTIQYFDRKYRDEYKDQARRRLREQHDPIGAKDLIQQNVLENQYASDEVKEEAQAFIADEIQPELDKLQAAEAARKEAEAAINHDDYLEAQRKLNQARDHWPHLEALDTTSQRLQQESLRYVKDRIASTKRQIIKATRRADLSRANDALDDIQQLLSLPHLKSQLQNQVQQLQDRYRVMVEEFNTIDELKPALRQHLQNEEFNAARRKLNDFLAGYRSDDAQNALWSRHPDLSELRDELQLRSDLSGLRQRAEKLIGQYRYEEIQQVLQLCETALNEYPEQAAEVNLKPVQRDLQSYYHIIMAEEAWRNYDDDRDTDIITTEYGASVEFVLEHTASSGDPARQLILPAQLTGGSYTATFAPEAPGRYRATVAVASSRRNLTFATRPVDVNVRPITATFEIEQTPALDTSGATPRLERETPVNFAITLYDGSPGSGQPVQDPDLRLSSTLFFSPANGTDTVQNDDLPDSRREQLAVQELNYEEGVYRGTFAESNFSREGVYTIELNSTATDSAKWKSKQLH
jgi:hypothetical protein